MEKKYLSCAETAKLVRTALKKNFPGVTFSVRSDVYSGGASIDVSWVLGPTTKEVDAIAGQYESADFDGVSTWRLITTTGYCRMVPQSSNMALVPRARWATFQQSTIRCQMEQYQFPSVPITCSVNGGSPTIGRTKQP